MDKIYMNNLELENNPIKVSNLTSAPMEGKIQAVSEGGSVIVTMDDEAEVHVYHLDGEIWNKTLNLPVDFDVPRIVSLYEEESTPFFSFHPRVFNNETVVFIVSEDASSVLKVTMDDIGGSSISFEEESFSEVLDVAIHPDEDCLAVLTKNSIELSFRDAGNQSLSLPTSASAVKTGKVKLVEDEDGLINYFAFLVEDHNDIEMHIHKYVEMDYWSSTYSGVESQEIDISQSSYDHERFSGINYDPSTRLFAYTNDFLEGISLMRRNEFIDLDLNVERWVSDPDMGPQTSFHFVDFIEGQNKLLMASLWYYIDNPYKLHPRSLCVVPFEVFDGNDTIYIHTSQAECQYGDIMNERVSTWVSSNCTHILLQYGSQITVYDEELQHVAQLEGQAFSVKRETDLMVANEGQLKISSNFDDFDRWEGSNYDYFFWPFYDEEQQAYANANQETDSLGFILGLTVPFAFFFLIGIGALIVICIRKRSREREQQQQEQMDHHPSIDQIYIRPAKNNEDIFDEKERQSALCSICLAGECDCYLPCHHLFHERCIRQWMTRKSSCPECRSRGTRITMIK